MNLVTPRALWLALLVPTLTGCGLTNEQVQAVRDFNGTSQEVVVLSREALSKTRADLVSFQTRLYRLGDTNLDMQALDDPLTEARMTPRLEALKVTSEFGRMLEQVATFNTDRTASLTAGLAVRGMQLHGGLPPDKATAIASLVNNLAGWFLERRKKNAVTTACLETSVEFRKLVEVLRVEFDPADPPAPNSLLGALETCKSEAKSLGMIVSNLVAPAQHPTYESGSGLVSKATTASEVKELQRDLTALSLEIDLAISARRVQFISLHSALDRLGDAHGALTNVLTSKRAYGGTTASNLAAVLADIATTLDHSELARELIAPSSKWSR